MSYDEKEEFEVCGVHYKATRPEANEIMAEVIQTQEWARYAMLHDLVHYGTFQADAAGEELVQRFHDAYVAAFRKAKVIIERRTREIGSSW